MKMDIRELSDVEEFGQLYNDFSTSTLEWKTMSSSEVGIRMLKKERN